MAWEGISFIGKPNLVISIGNLSSSDTAMNFLQTTYWLTLLLLQGDGYQLVGDNGYCLLVWLLSCFVQVIHVTRLVELA